MLTFLRKVFFTSLDPEEPTDNRLEEETKKLSESAEELKRLQEALEEKREVIKQLKISSHPPPPNPEPPSKTPSSEDLSSG